MPYERGDLTSATAIGPASEFRAVGRDATILEWGIALNAAVASIFGIGYSANTPAGGTVGVGVNTARGGGAPGGGTVLTGQSTPPTSPSPFFRRYGLPGGPRSEPGGQNTPRAGRVVASYGTYTVAAGTFAQQVDQGDIWDDAATAIVTAGGSGVESYVYVPPYTDSGTGTVTASGTGFQTYTPYDAVLDEDNPVSHWKLGDASTAIDRRGVRNHPAINGPIDTAAGLVANNASDQSNVFTGVANVSFNAGTGTGFGLPYEGAYTMEAWVKPTADFDGLVVKRTVATYLALLNTNSGSGSAVQVGFSVENSANVSFNLTSPFADLLPLNQTFHIVGTYDGTTAILYINGVEAKRTTSVGVGGIRSSTTTPPFIGAARVATRLSRDRVRGLVILTALLLMLMVHCITLPTCRSKHGSSRVQRPLVAATAFYGVPQVKSALASYLLNHYSNSLLPVTLPRRLSVLHL
jgi:hypothetical protein